MPSVDNAVGRKQRPLSSVDQNNKVTERSQVHPGATRTVGKQQFSGGISQLDERTDMTSLNKDSTFEREDLSEMLSAGQKSGKNGTAKNETLGQSRLKASKVNQMMIPEAQESEEDILSKQKSLEKEQLQKKLFQQNQDN